MNMRHIYIISILIITMIGLGCIDKSLEDIPPTNISIQKNISKDISTNMPTPEVTELGNMSTPEVTELGNMSTPEVTEPGNTSTPEVTDVPINDTSVTEIFKIGDQKNMLGVNIKLINITDYNNNTAIINIDGIEYKYDSDATIQVKGVEIIDIISSEGDKTAEITVDYVSSQT